jgi:hypothetical protein
MLMGMYELKGDPEELLVAYDRRWKTCRRTVYRSTPASVDRPAS